jgi:uncharacterized protein (TIGR03545 family)
MEDLSGDQQEHACALVRQTSESGGMTMRKKFVFFILVPLLLFCVAIYLFADRWIESALEAVGEGIVGAKVEIDHLHISVSPIAIEFARLQVASPKDPWQNIFETGKVRFALNFGQLLRNKYIIETMEVNNLVFGTKRLTDGSLPQPKPEESPSIIAQATAAVTREVQKAPVFDLDKLRKGLNIDSLVNVQNLRTVQHLDSLKTQVQEASQQWDATLADIDKSKRQITEIQTSAVSNKSSCVWVKLCFCCCDSEETFGLPAEERGAFHGRHCRSNIS